MEILQMAGITKSFGAGPVLDDVDWDVLPGEVHVLAGENGAGKTTLIKILAGVHAHDSGEIRLEGRKTAFRSPVDAARRGISAIHQDTSLVPSMNVVDNIFLGREIAPGGLRMDFRAERREARRLLGQLGLDVDLARPLGDFPVAVRQLVEIAKALVFDARIIIMDEPTSALNDTETSRLFDIVRALRDKGRAVVFISHRLEEIYRLGDRITVLRDGRRVGTFSAGDLPPERLVAAMVGRDIEQQFPPRRAKPGRTILKVRDFTVADAAGGKAWVVEGASFDLHEGEILGFVGLQGSGKSEFFHGLFGALGGGAGGRVELDGREFIPRSPAASIRRGLALVTNDRKRSGLVFGLSVARNISLPSLPAFSPRGWIRTSSEAAVAEEAVRDYDIRVRSVDQDVGTLSGGNQQKVVLAKWLETRPKVLLLDEPTIGVDVGAKSEIYRMMNAWTESGMAILLITSELPELLAMSDRVLVMHRGRIVSTFGRAEATQERVVKAAMGQEADS
ncbi:MAG: sugar ABC transporter ATP-binding protein [Candidatus Aminicenantes bacterium]|nr:sugar ABC transporter ATP-binding protein [Candidatus Aminicenantes bacterium]